MKLLIVAGKSNIDWAKMMAMMPAVSTLSGMNEFWIPAVFPLTARRACCTGMRRWACVTSVVKSTTVTKKNNSISTVRGCNCAAPACLGASNRTVCSTAAGPDDKMPAVIMMDIPLPIPCSCMRSPSHMISRVPAVSVIMVVSRNGSPGLFTICKPWKKVAWELSSQRAIKNDWIAASPTVP